MSQSRIRTALEDGLLSLDDEPIKVIRPSPQYDVAALPRERVTISHGYFPDYAAFEMAGYPVTTDIEHCKIAIVVVPRSKALAKALVAEACSKADMVIVDGQKTDGVDSLFKACRKALGNLPSVTKAHGRMFWFPATPAFETWAIGDPVRAEHGFFTTAGVFSQNAIDAGSALLAQALPAKLPGKMADLGAGWGYLAPTVLERSGVKALHLIEAEHASLECARLNVTDDRVRFHWGDATNFTAETGFDGIVMNPPFHTGRDADPDLGRQFITAAAKLLAPNGKLWMVANRHLPYETTLATCFRNVDMIAGNAAFKVFHANRPQR